MLATMKVQDRTLQDVNGWRFQLRMEFREGYRVFRVSRHSAFLNIA
jgi:hypothetical protein